MESKKYRKYLWGVSLSTFQVVLYVHKIPYAYKRASNLNGATTVTEQTLGTSILTIRTLRTNTIPKLL